MSDTPARPTFDKLKERGIPVLAIHRLLVCCNILVSKRTVQNYLDTEFKSCPDDRIKAVVRDVITNHDKLQKRLETKYKVIF